MQYVTFGSKRSDTDYGLILSTKSIGFPEIVENRIEVPGRDGTLDFTEFFGRTIYRNRQLIFKFGFVNQNRITQDRTLKNALHGKKLKIFCSEDQTHYFFGRLSVGELVYYCGTDSIEVTCDCDPWAYKSTVTTVSKSNLTTQYQDITLANEYRPVVPEITVSAETTVKLGSSTWVISAGSHLIPELELASGTTTISAKVTTGTGTISIKYQEASL